jgi:hypothetical protein
LTNIIPFPGVKKEPETAFDEPYQKPGRLVRSKAFLRVLLKLFQIFMVFGWPIIRWFVYADLLFTFLRMLFHTRPYAGFVFGLHVSVFFIAVFLVGFCGFNSSPSLKKQPKHHQSTDSKRKQFCN